MLKVFTYTLPAYWASYLINGDASGLEDGEQAMIDAFVTREGNPHFCDCGDETWFAWSNDAHTRLGGDVCRFTAYKNNQ